ncbi:hypothetical protein KBD45_00880 [Candidatus Dojkabacteria bacterium]|nr:hypothetical protein [Candidatus Dojkabacteria bacterium]
MQFFPLTQDEMGNLETVGFNELFESHFYDEGKTTRGNRNIYRFGLFVAK